MFSLSAVKPTGRADEDDDDDDSSANGGIDDVDDPELLESGLGGEGGLNELLRGRDEYLEMLAHVVEAGSESGWQELGEDQGEAGDDFTLSYYMGSASAAVPSLSVAPAAVEEREADPPLEVASRLLSPPKHPRILHREVEVNVDSELPTISCGEAEDPPDLVPSACPFPVVTCAADLAAVSGSVITTPCLWKFGYCLLREPFTILLCWKCEEAIPYSCVKKHMKSTKRGRIPVFRNGKWGKPQKTDPCLHKTVDDHRAPAKMMANLLELGIIKDEGELMTGKEDQTGNGFREAAVPPCFPEPCPLIPGLRIYEGAFQCPVPGCHYWCLSKDTVKTHRYKYHNEDGEEAITGYKVSEHPVQSLYSNYARWFPVIASNTPSSALPAVEERQLMLEGLQPEAAFQPAADYYRQLKDQRLQPYLDSSKIEGWLSGWVDRADVGRARQDHLNFKKRPLAYTNLRRLSLLVLVENNYLLSKTHHGPPSRAPRLLPLNRERTIQAYGTYETQMLWVLCQNSLKEPPPKSASKTQQDVFKFTTEQRRLLNQLLEILEEEVLNESAGKDALRRAVESLYFPVDLSPGNTCVFDFPPWIAKLTYSFRVHANWRIDQLHQGACAAEGGCPKPKVEDSAKPFIREMLNPNGASPYSSVRFLMHILSRISFSVVREGTAQWDGSVVHTEEGTISLPHFRSQLWDSVLEVEAFYETRIFLGLGTLDEFIERFGVAQLTDDLNNTEKGYGVSHENRKGHENQEFSLFMEMVMSGGCLGFGHDGARGGLVYNVDAMDAWLADVDLGLRMLYALVHFTQGPPGRGTEELVLQITNTERGIKRNLIWDPVMQTGGFNYDYQKTSGRQGVLSNILRLLPFRIFALLHLHMRIVRPMEATYALRTIQQTKRLTMSAAYSTQVYVSNGRLWRTEDLSSSIADWANRALGVSWNLRSFRHFSALFSRRELNFKLTGSERESVDRCEDMLQGKKDKEKVERLRLMDRVVDMMRGHSSDVADSHYGREVADGGAKVGDRAQQRVVIRAYHEALNLSTAYQPLSEDDQARKERYCKHFNELVPGANNEEHEQGEKKPASRTGKQGKKSKVEKGSRDQKSAPVAQGQDFGGEQEGMSELAGAVAAMSIEAAAVGGRRKGSNATKRKQGGKSAGKQREHSDHYCDEMSESSEEEGEVISLDDSPYVARIPSPIPSGSEPVRRSGRAHKPTKRFEE
ncbi:hypothetical protein H1R20_g4171, partial [Candolleomyces eurysporus]